MTANPPDDQPTTDEGGYLFRDTVLDFVPYEELPYAMLLDKAELGDEAAESELNRRAEEQVEKDIEAIQDRNRAAEAPTNSPGEQGQNRPAYVERRPNTNLT